MPIATLKDVCEKAMGADYAVGSFNVFNLEFMQGTMRAVEEMHSPVIISIAPVSIEYAGLEELAALARVYAERTPVPVVIHLDHGRDIETVRRSLQAGFSSVMFDGSTLSMEENMRKTREVVKVAHMETVGGSPTRSGPFPNRSRPRSEPLPTWKQLGRSDRGPAGSARSLPGCSGPRNVPTAIAAGTASPIRAGDVRAGAGYGAGDPRTGWA